jgi:hypothetical protein
MSWNYRIVKDKNGFSFREVFYNKKGEICAMTEDEIAPFSDESPAGLIKVLEMMLKDANKCKNDIIDEDKVKFKKWG